MNSERASAGATPRGCWGSKRRSWAPEIAALGSHERHESTKDTKKTVTAGPLCGPSRGLRLRRFCLRCLFRDFRGDAALDAFVSFVVSGYRVVAITVM